jgi:hypothetical protein
MVLIAARRWGAWWTNRKVLFRIDNFTAASAINKGTTRSSGVMHIVREVFWVSVLGNFEIKC